MGYKFNFQQSKEEFVRGGGFNMDHPSLMFEISLHVSNLSGKFVWFFTQNGRYTVKSGYKTAKSVGFKWGR